MLALVYQQFMLQKFDKIPQRLIPPELRPCCHNQFVLWLCICNHLCEQLKRLDPAQPRQVVLLTSTLGHKHREAVPTRLAGIYYVSRDSSWGPVSEAPCRNHQAALPDAPGNPQSTGQGSPWAIRSAPTARPKLWQQASAASQATYLQGLMPVCILMPADVKVSNTADPVFI